jgi:hypothetical protein
MALPLVILKTQEVNPSMQIDLRTVSIKQRRNTFDHLARRFGDKPASQGRMAEFRSDRQPGGQRHRA